MRGFPDALLTLGIAKVCNKRVLYLPKRRLSGTLVQRWEVRLSADSQAETIRQFRRQEATERPVSSQRFLKLLETILDRLLHPQKPD